MGFEAPGHGDGRAAAIREFSKDLSFSDNSLEVAAAPVKELNECCSASSASSTTSSIGRNSDEVSANDSSEGEDSGDNEAESAFKGPLDMMDALEEVLPVRRGISMFYNGKSKSFATLAEASASSIKDIVKPENAYTRKRRNLLAFNHVWDKNKSFGGISKRPISSSRSTLAFAVAMNSSDSSSSMSEDSNSSHTSRSPPTRPPLYRKGGLLSTSPSSSPPQEKFTPWRSLSLFDLQHSTVN